MIAGGLVVPTLGSAVAQACAFAATIPLYGDPGSMRTVRAALAVVLVPTLLAAGPHGGAVTGAGVFAAAAQAAAIGLFATLVTGAVAGAASIVDAGLAWSPMSGRVAGSGPLTHLYQLGFTGVLFGSGAFTKVLASLVGARAQFFTHPPAWQVVAHLTATGFEDALLLGAPALLAQVIASLIAGVIARAAPGINGIMVSAPCVSAAVLLTLLAGCPLLASLFNLVASSAVVAARDALP